MQIPTHLPDNHQLRQWQDNFLRLNRLRLERASTLLPARQQRLLELLPLLLHLNHPQLPGFVDHDTPAGIELWQASPSTLQAARSLLPNSPKLERSDSRNPAIAALYLMGSPGSLAQNRSSDFDVWVCLSAPLSLENHQRLQEKCRRLEQWATTQGGELHLFPMDLDAFRNGLQRQSDSEDCGSSQYMLLLDEFYRSALWLAGRWPRWWIVPECWHQHSDQYWQQLVDAHLTRPEQWLDIGTIRDIPPDEFLGAALWQLNKGLHDPYKALLKLQLCRHYAEQYPHIRPLSNDLKDILHHLTEDEATAMLDECDPYRLLLSRIDSTATSVDRRTALIRKAFYFKTGLTARWMRENNNWRSRAMNMLIQKWGWSEQEQDDLDQRHQWSPQRIFKERNALVAEMLAAWRQLSQFSLRLSQQLHINPTDMRILGNQLTAAFDSRPGKIIRINPGISRSSSQEQLTLFHYPGVWQLAVGRWTTPPPDRQILKQSPSLIELLLFCLHNQLWNRNTGLHCEPASAINGAELQQTLRTLMAIWQQQNRNGDWASVQSLRHMHLFINVATDPLDRYSRVGLQKLSDLDDPLNFSATHTSLVASIDVITINSWNEWQVVRYQGPQALADVLPLVVQALNAKTRPVLEVHCHNANRPGRIRQRVVGLLTRILRHQRRRSGPYLFALGEHWWWQEPCNSDDPLANHSGQGQCLRLESEAALWQQLQQPVEGFHPLAVDRWLKTPWPLAIITEQMAPDRWQLFYLREGQQVTFYLADECGAMLHQQVQYQQLSHWLLPTLRFLVRLQQRWLYLPGKQAVSLHLYELRNTSEGWTCLPRPLPDTEHRSAPVELSASIDHDRQPTLYCNHEEFSIWQYGSDLYPAVAERVISLRSRQERYPCYLSELSIAIGSGLLQHWQLKQQIESDLARALQNS